MPTAGYQPRELNRPQMVLPGKRPQAPQNSLGGPFGRDSNGCRLACPENWRLLACLEGRSVEEPDRQCADRDDPKEDQDERDVRLTFGVVLGETVHQQAATTEQAPAPVLLDPVRQSSPSKVVVGRRCEQAPTAALLDLVELRGIEPRTS
jgi:hypothetical protein